MSKLLTAVRRAANKRRDADAAYRQAIRDARDAGHTLAQIGEQADLGVTGVRYLLYPDPRKQEKP